MVNKVMLSHAATDQPVAELLATLLRKCSLSQIEPWYSSDPSQGGIGAGQRWFERIRQEMLESKSCRDFTYANSISSSWVQFEAGFGAGTAELELIPVTIKLEDLTLVPNPISHWQIFPIDRFDLAISFIRKVLGAFSIHFDDELVTLAVKRALKELAWLSADQQPNSKSVTKVMKPINPDLRRYLDQKFFDLYSNIVGNKSNVPSFDVRIKSKVNGGDFSITIGIETTLEDALTEIFRHLDGAVSPYSYLDSWILIDDSTHSPVIVKAVQHLIPAHVIFRLDHEFSVAPLDTPYIAGAKRMPGIYGSDDHVE